MLFFCSYLICPGVQQKRNKINEVCNFSFGRYLILRPKFTRLLVLWQHALFQQLFLTMCLPIKQVNVDRKLRVEAYPHFMEKKGVESYHSISILGRIYDETEKVISQQCDEQIGMLSLSIALHCHFLSLIFWFSLITWTWVVWMYTHTLNQLI